MDKIDHTILNELAGGGRITFRDLASRVHLSPNAVAERFRRLMANGTIRRVRAELNPAAFGRTIEALVEVKLNPDTSAMAFEAALRHLPQLVTETLRRHGVRDTYTRLLLRELQFS